jgi:PDZ domain
MAPRLATLPTPSATRVPRRFARLALAIVHVAIVNMCMTASALAGERPLDPEPPSQTFMTLQDMLERSSNWSDPKYVRGWNSYCAKNPERGGCETVLRRYGHRPVIGVVLAPDETRGVRIAGVTPEGPADRAGIKAGDRMIAINGVEIEGSNAQSRVENARRTLLGFKSKDTVQIHYEREERRLDASMKPKLDARLMILANDGRVLRPKADVAVRRDGQGRVGVVTDGIGLQMPGDKTPTAPSSKDALGHPVQIAGINPIRDLLIDPDCDEGRPCSSLRLSEAFRWNGFNLATVDPQLGRYFGATEGVLVLSSSPLLPELQAGDVIRMVDGLAVTTPRAVMDALRSKPAESVVEFDLIRDRRSTSARIKLPESLAVVPAMSDQYADPAGEGPQAPKTGSRIRR